MARRHRFLSFYLKQVSGLLAVVCYHHIASQLTLHRPVDHPGVIDITQPRRVAAMSMASRVAHELSLPSSRVSYQIRYDATVSPLTSMNFMTDGVLLRELAPDFVLSKYSVLIIDEAHERSMNTDMLIGVVSRVVDFLGYYIFRRSNNEKHELRNGRNPKRACV